MRVYFVGAHSVGKSTLARYVSNQYHLPMIPEVARMVLAEMELQIDTLRSDIETVNSYQSKVFHRQIEEEQKYKDFVADRSLIDNIAYSAQHSTILSKLLQDSQLSEYLDRLKDKKSIIFFVRPALATLKNDGIRENVNWEGVIAIDAVIKTFLSMFEIKFFQINTDNMQERANLIDTTLSFVSQ